MKTLDVERCFVIPCIFPVHWYHWVQSSVEELRGNPHISVPHISGTNKPINLLKESFIIILNHVRFLVNSCRVKLALLWSVILMFQHLSVCEPCVFCLIGFFLVCFHIKSA